jgi:hypothetical protein
LDQVTGFKVERATLLGNYIEPRDEDISSDAKVPQAAHRAIARLVRGGYVRVIITTNFDQLLEEALRAVNVTPRVVSTADAVEQALPLVHQQCTLIKVHGDYTSRELMNITEELATYDERLSRLLERVFSDFGVIVCGWSAQWDHALRVILSGNASRAYSMFWAVRGVVNEEAEALIDGRQGKAVIEIESADSFFQLLEEKVRAIADLMSSTALVPAVAAATMERYLRDPYGNRIRIDRLVLSEVERVLTWLHEHVVIPTGPSAAGRFQQDLPALLDVSGSLVNLFAHGGRWGEAEQHATWSKALTRLLNDSLDRAPALRWGGFWGYLSTMIAYAGGIAALVGDRYDTLRCILEAPVADLNQRRISVAEVIGEVDLFHIRDSSLLNKGQSFPLSQEMRKRLRQPLLSTTPDQTIYEEVFDRYEYLQALVHIDAEVQGGETNPRWAPIGWFWSDLKTRGQNSMVARVDAEFESQGGAWAPLQAGLFGGDSDRVMFAQEQLRTIMQQWK